MQTNNKYFVVSMRNYLSKNSELGEDVLKQMLSEFSCTKNEDVDKFLKKSAIEFTKKNQSVTYLVFTAEEGIFVGYFTIAVKPIMIAGQTVDGKMGNRTRNKIKRVSEIDPKTKKYNMAAYLIAQLGRNFMDGANEKISGSELLELAWQVVAKMQDLGGGMVVFLEANNEEKLLDFYEKNGFQRFDTRKKKSDSLEEHELVQLLKLL